MKKLLSSFLVLAFVVSTLFAAFAVRAETINLQPFADAYVRADRATTNYGYDAFIGSDGSPRTIAYLAFDLSGLAFPIDSAILRMTVVDATNDGPAVYLADNGWDEATVTYQTKPSIVSNGRDSKGALAVGDVVEWNVAPFLDGPRVYTFALRQSSSNGADFGSRESSAPPLLIIGRADPTAEPTIEPTLEPTLEPTAEPTLEPTLEPTVEPTVEPTSEPTLEPTSEPTLEPTIAPTSAPTAEPIDLVVEVGESVQAALDLAREGDTVLLRGGTHVLPSTLDTVRGGVTITSYPNEVAIIDGGFAFDPVVKIDEADTKLLNLVVQNAGGQYGDTIDVRAYGVVVSHVTARGANQAGINVRPSAGDVRVLNCDVSDAATAVQIGASNVLVQGCAFHDITKMVNDNDCAKAHGGQGVAVNNSVGPVEVTENVGWNLRASSVCFGEDGAFVELFNAQNVLVHRNRAEGGVVFVESYNSTVGNVLYRNEVANQAFLTLHDASGLTVDHNTVVGMTANSWFGGSTVNTTFTNNILVGATRFFYISNPLQGRFAHNLYFAQGSVEFGVIAGTRYTSASAWLANETNSKSGDPLLDGYALREGSPAIDAAELSGDYLGNAPDIGANESSFVVAPTPTATPTPIPTPTPTPMPTPTPSSGDVVVVAVGDIACDPSNGGFNSGNGTSTSCRQKYTAALVDQIDPTAVLMLGDAQYELGTLANFDRSYNPSWGAHKGITYAVAGGSHDYYGGGDFYTYFGQRAGPSPKKNWYSFDLGSWHIIALASYCDNNGNCAEMESWLRADLAAHQNSCTLAMWHEPRYSSGYRHGDQTSIDWAWDLLYANGAEIVLSGHEHNYERFAPMNASGAADPNGLREFVVGTGGKSLESGWGTIKANSEVRQRDTYGVLKLTLSDNGYAWEFVAEAGKTFTDVGNGTCH